MGILGVSRQIYQEASPLVRKAGIFRIHTQCYATEYDIQTPPLNAATSILVQNIEISVMIISANSHRTWDSGAMNVFMNATTVVNRDTCYIKLKTSIHQGLYVRPEYLLRSIKMLQGFKRIVVTATAIGCADYVEAQRVVIRARNKPVYEMALKELEPVFGSGVWHDAATQEGRYLEFHP